MLGACECATLQECAHALKRVCTSEPPSPLQGLAAGSSAVLGLGLSGAGPADLRAEWGNLLFGHHLWRLCATDGRGVALLCPPLSSLVVIWPLV